MPTRLWWTAGLMIEPSVSVPTPIGAMSSATAAAVPLLEPLGVEREVVGIEDLTAQRGVARGHSFGEEVGQFGEVGLGEDHGARFAQSPDQVGVSRCRGSRKSNGASRSGLSGDVDVVLDDRQVCLREDCVVHAGSGTGRWPLPARWRRASQRGSLRRGDRAARCATGAKGQTDGCSSCPQTSPGQARRPCQRSRGSIIPGSWRGVTKRPVGDDALMSSIRRLGSPRSSRVEPPSAAPTSRDEGHRRVYRASCGRGRGEAGGRSLARVVALRHRRHLDSDGPPLCRCDCAPADHRHFVGPLPGRRLGGGRRLPDRHDDEPARAPLQSSHRCRRRSPGALGGFLGALAGIEGWVIYPLVALWTAASGLAVAISPRAALGGRFLGDGVALRRVVPGLHAAVGGGRRLDARGRPWRGRDRLGAHGLGGSGAPQPRRGQRPPGSGGSAPAPEPSAGGSPSTRYWPTTRPG